MTRRKPLTLPQTIIDYSQPCKNGQPYVSPDGSCLRCGADQGVSGPKGACRPDEGLLEALRFYAMQKHHHGDILIDRGEVARAALAKAGCQ